MITNTFSDTHELRVSFRLSSKLRFAAAHAIDIAQKTAMFR